MLIWRTIAEVMFVSWEKGRASLCKINSCHKVLETSCNCHGSDNKNKGSIKKQRYWDVLSDEISGTNPISANNETIMDICSHYVTVRTHFAVGSFLSYFLLYFLCIFFFLWLYFLSCHFFYFALSLFPSFLFLLRSSEPLANSKFLSNLLYSIILLWELLSEAYST